VRTISRVIGVSGKWGFDDWEAEQVGDWGGEVQLGGLELLEQAD
jgi:hypothetical protein